MKSFSHLLLLAALGTASVPGWTEQGWPTEFPDELVDFFVEVARSSIGEAVLADGSRVPSETLEELAKPIVPVAVARTVLKAGYVSATAQWCRVEWETSSFGRMMAAERAKGIWSDKQLAFIGMLHGATMGVFGRQYESRGGCPAPERSRVAAHLADDR